MEKLLESLTRAANAVAAYYEAQTAEFALKTGKTCDKVCTPEPRAFGRKSVTLPADAPIPAEPPQEVPLETPAKRKPGRPRATPKTDAPAAAPKKEEAPSGLPVDPEFAALTEEESTKRVYEIGEAMMDAYPKEEAGKNAPDGSPAPEGYFICASIMKERFGVERLSKMNHAQRLQFMTILKGYLAKAVKSEAGALAAVGSAAAGDGPIDNDPNLGV